jgi:putative glutamine amidotransferase
MTPLIGITSGYNIEKLQYTIPDAYVKAVQRNNGTPILLPPLMETDIDKQLSAIDGLIISGGPDVDPMLYGEQPTPKQGQIVPMRNQYELTISKMALETNTPTLGICGGCQILNVAVGGSLVQDINTQIENSIKHSQEAPANHATHSVRLELDSKLGAIFGKEVIIVNSFHHQAVNKPGDGINMTAWAFDGVIEGFEMDKEQFVVGVQWHPEYMEEMNRLFSAFIESCQ